MHSRSTLLVVFVSLLLSTPLLAQSESLEKILAEESIDVHAARAAEGDPQRGALLFYKPEMNCATCHQPQGESGLRLGPDLAERREVEPSHIVESILDPHKIIREGYQTAVVRTFEGDQFEGVLVEESEDSLSIAGIEDKKVRTFAQDDIEWRLSEKSTMPVGLANQLADKQQFYDLVSYLLSVAEEGAVREAQLRPAWSLYPPPPLPEYEKRIDHSAMIASLNNPAFDRGQQIFALHCASCHGSINDDGTVAEEGSMPTSLQFVSGKFKNGNDPYTMYQTLTHGYGMMNAQRWMVPRQKYDVIHFIRESYLRRHNPGQLFEITDEYLAALPEGDTFGPEPAGTQPWVQMNYGPSMMNTIEIEGNFGQPGNIAQKGIAVRLDNGPGGVESGSHWLMYEHDTMRVAGAWSGDFINYEGIHFDGRHNAHPKVTGDVHFSNPTAPGWGRPDDGSFADTRVEGRDGRRYGPLDRDWVKYRGMYRYADESILSYSVAGTPVLESPDLLFANDSPVFVRQLNLSEREEPLILQIATLDPALGYVPVMDDEDDFQPSEDGVIRSKTDLSQLTFTNVHFLNGSDDQEPESVDACQSDEGILFNGRSFAQADSGELFNMHDADFTIAAMIKTNENGTIFAKTVDGEEWVPDGKTFFVRGGRLTYDIGWVGAIQSSRKVNDGQWHHVAMTWSADAGEASFYIDGRQRGGGELRPEGPVDDHVIRIGFTNDNFPATSFFEGNINGVEFYQSVLSEDQLRELAGGNDIESESLLACWNRHDGDELVDDAGESSAIMFADGSIEESAQQVGLVFGVSESLAGASWILDGSSLRLEIPPGAAVDFSVFHAPVHNSDEMDDATRVDSVANSLPLNSPTVDLEALTQGGPANWPEILETEIVMDDTEGPFAVDVFTRPTDNPWNCRMRLTGVDFLPESDGDVAIVPAWDGSVWRVSGIKSASSGGSKISWQRIAAGLFQPLGVRIRDGEIFVTCRDQLVRLHDLNGDGEMDFYESFNSDHQVTEHFHEFAMGLQTDDDGNFYYAKSARHALQAVVPHHGTLLKVAADGSSTEIVANGFRAANGVCINPDGSFYVTDQEGHWNPKNRINRVVPGGFYGNMFGYHDVEDDSDEAMDPPLCWITNSFDRSPAELLWVDSDKWGGLNGALLNTSYGYGQIYVATEENVNGRYQGGMCALPIPRFPTGVMRGRFHDDGQLYCCGMFAWSGTQQEPGGFYRVRHTGQASNLPIGLHALGNGIQIQYSDPLDVATASDPANYRIETWHIKRSARYGSDHFDQQQLEVTDARVASDGMTVTLTVPDIEPTRCMEIVFTLKGEDGTDFSGKIHNTIHELASPDDP
ncbi:MAG: DUF6797 domain-containing protein [Planctomycetota bacterium]